MKSIDRFNIGLIIVCTVIYIILCYKTKYKNITSDTSDIYNNRLTPQDYKLLYFTTVFGFIYGAILISFQQRYLTQKVSSLCSWIMILFISILLVFSAFYTQIYPNENPNSFISKFSYAIIPILPSLVILAESAISEVLEHGFSEPNIPYTGRLIGGDSEINRTDEFWYVSER